MKPLQQFEKLQGSMDEAAFHHGLRGDLREEMDEAGGAVEVEVRGDGKVNLHPRFPKGDERGVAMEQSRGVCDGDDPH